VSFTVITLIAVLVACSPIKTRFNYDENFDFSSYKSFNIVPNEQIDLVGLSMEKQHLDELITKTINQQLTANGFRSDKNNPDFLVAYYVVTNNKTDVYYLDNYYAGIGYAPNRSSTRDFNRIMETTYEQGILIVDVIDSKNKERIWSGHSESRLGIYTEPEQIERRIEAAVRKIITRFPPV